MNDFLLFPGVEFTTYQGHANGIGATKWVESQGITQEKEGYHDDFVMTAQMLSIDPKSVRMKRLNLRL